MGAVGYVVSREGARKFLARATRLAHAVDKKIHRTWAHGLDVYGLERRAVEHADNGHSYIEGRRVPDVPSTPMSTMSRLPTPELRRVCK